MQLPYYFYVVYFKSLATGAIYSYHVTSDAYGLLTLQFVDGFPLADGMAYEMWVNKQGDSIDTQLALLVGDVSGTCFTLSGQNIFDIYYDANENFTSQTLEIAE